MFNTEMELSTFIITIIEFVILFFQFINYLERTQDKSRLRFLILILMFLFYNISSGLLPDKNINISILLQNVLAFGSGIILASYYFYYLVKELNMTQGKLFNTKMLLLGLISSFILGFVFTYIFTGNISFSIKAFIIFPIIISIYFCVKTVQFLSNKRKKYSNKKTPYKLMVFAGYIGIIFMATMPIVVFFGDHQIINNTLVNISFFIVYYAYIKYHLFQSKIEYELLDNIGFYKENLIENTPKQLTSFSLTKRELEVAYMILQNLNYNEISEDMFISPKTVSKHASNIFKKTTCRNKNDFLAHFSI